MKNIKQFFTYMVVRALVIALSISCKNNETDPNAGKFKLSDLVGTWTGDAGSFTLDGSGTVNFTYQGTTYNGQLFDNMQDESFTVGVTLFDTVYSDSVAHANGAKRKNAGFVFSSSSSCTVSIREDTYSGTYPNGSWQLGSPNSIGTFTK